MHLGTKKFLGKVFALSIFIVLIFNIGYNFINASLSPEKEVHNSDIFKKSSQVSLGKTGVALATNIAIYFQEKNSIPVTVYKDIFSIEALQNTKQGEDLLEINMISIKEYLNVLKTDVKTLIKNSYDKSNTLNAFIDQLEYRYINGIESEKKLINQKNSIIASMNELQGEIDIIKQKMEADFSKSEYASSQENIEKFLKLKNDFHTAKTYLVYVNHFINQYDFLNNYNKNLASMLISNKNAIIKDAYVVIPEKGGLEMLKDFDLLYDKEDITP